MRSKVPLLMCVNDSVFVFAVHPLNVVMISCNPLSIDADLFPFNTSAFTNEISCAIITSPIT